MCAGQAIIWHFFKWKVFLLLPQAILPGDISVTRDISMSLVDSVPYPRAQKAFGTVGIQTHLQIIMNQPQFPICISPTKDQATGLTGCGSDQSSRLT